MLSTDVLSWGQDLQRYDGDRVVVLFESVGQRTCCVHEAVEPQEDSSAFACAPIIVNPPSTMNEAPVA